MIEELIFEKEMEIPDNWESNIILIKDGNGNVIEREIPDDIEEE
jgi:hypothetical protein